MQSFHEFLCADCDSSFDMASELLKHFALHFSQTSTMKFKEVPQLYPIVNCKVSAIFRKENVNLESEDSDPLSFCAVNFANRLSDENEDEHSIEVKPNHTESNSSIHKKLLKKYQCTYCFKSFGWCTDLKRHILIHTGERPFKCQHCNLSFTRNFLLQKHLRKYSCVDTSHFGKVKIPALRPLILQRKMYKRDTKAKSCKVKNV